MKVTKLVLLVALAVSMAGCVNISGIKETDADGKTTSRESYSFGTVPPAGVGVGVGIGIIPRNQYGHDPHVGPYVRVSPSYSTERRSTDVLGQSRKSDSVFSTSELLSRWKKQNRGAWSYQAPYF